MEPGESLVIAAQVAVALAGFAGVVVVFRRESVHEWSAVDKLRLRLLLGNSILPLVLCMLGMVLLTIKPMPDGILRWCSGIAFVVSLIVAVTMTKYFRRLDMRQVKRERATRFVFIYSECSVKRQPSCNCITPRLSAYSGRSSPELCGRLSLRCSSLRA